MNLSAELKILDRRCHLTAFDFVGTSRSDQGGHSLKVDAVMSPHNLSRLPGLIRILTAPLSVESRIIAVESSLANLQSWMMSDSISFICFGKE